MEKKILNSHTTTQKIMIEVQELTKDRNGVLITCAGKKHCEEAAHVLPEGTYGIVTDQTAKNKRAQILKDAKEGRLKYVLQIGCLTTGVNIPRWDTIVILRKIGSLTLLTQLIGRGLRLPEQGHDYQKENCLILDYSSTMQELGQLYHSPILEKAELQRARQSGDLITCPRCSTENSKYARRCVGESSEAVDGRCDFFWISKTCLACGTLNDTAARECRKCDAQLIDPNENLSGKHYTDDDLQNVVKMDVYLTKNQQGVLVRYLLESGEKPIEVFWPDPKNQIARKIWKMKFVFKHVRDNAWRSKVLRMVTATSIVNNKAVFDVPTQITWRKNTKGKDIIHRKIFRSGREEIDEDV
jgi:DNA repair protein RadD